MIVTRWLGSTLGVLGFGRIGLVGPRELKLPGPQGYFVNTSRGPVVDEAAVIDALTRGVIAGAALDVFDAEPMAAGHPLLTTPITTLSPHKGFVTEQAYSVAYGRAVEDIVTWLDGADAPGRLNSASERRRRLIA